MLDSRWCVIACGGTDQDGDLRTGVKPPTPRFTDNGDGTFTDNQSGLTWLKNANCPNATRTWEQALDDVAELNDNGTMNNAVAVGDCGDTGNQTDWHLPNVKEFQSLIDFGEKVPPLPTSHLFTNVVITFYWSSTTNATVTATAWAGSFSDGSVGAVTKNSIFRVLAVRGGL